MIQPLLAWLLGACWAQLAGGSETAIVVVTSLLFLVGMVGLISWRHPAGMAYFVIWIVSHTIYRLRVFGREHVPEQGGALLVCNHVSYLDWLFILASQRRIVRFVIFASWTKAWGLRSLLQWAKVIPIDGTGGPRAIVKSLRLASDALAAGELVCIFAEGRFTRTGFLLPFHRGFEQIVKHTPVPIIPVCLDHMWGSIFSYRGGKLIWKWPEQLPYPINVAFGKPLPSNSTAAQVRLTIQKLSSDCAIERSEQRRAIHRQFVHMAASHPFRPCLIDQNLPKGMLNYGKTLAAAMCMARHLRPMLGEAAMVGIWLPSSAGGALANITLALLGKTSVNLNYTAGNDVIQSAIQQCGIRKVLTSKRFLGKMALQTPADVEQIMLEDLAAKITMFAKLRSFLAVVLLPGFVLDHWVLRLAHGNLDDLATVIFSSGSTGEPKGVMLSHRNIAANAESMVQAIDLRAPDRALGILPFFHSFGYTVTLWVPLQVGASAVYHPDPRQAKEIGELCRKQRCTIFLTTPTFLRFCLRRCEPSDFVTVRILMCGAEKLPQPLALEFQKKFGVLPLEGYGCTELAPAAAANILDREVDNYRQIGNRPGSIGQPLPGNAAKVVVPETYEELPPGQEGLLLIHGANVMVGYLGNPELTRQVIREGWYVTGDMAKIDEDGFISITGRLARFAKIGGEMVPLERLEDEMHAILKTADRNVAITCVPDEARGERLIALYTHLDGIEVRELCKGLGAQGIPNLWIPAERDFFQVPELPILGAGKVNWPAVKTMALEKTKKG